MELGAELGAEGAGIVSVGDESCKIDDGVASFGEEEKERQTFQRPRSIYARRRSLGRRVDGSSARFLRLFFGFNSTQKKS